MSFCAEINARTGSELDYIYNDCSDEHIPLYDEYECDINIGPRTSMDQKVDQRGKQLLEFCISSKMRILNGRMLGDSSGKFTCIKSTGQSVVDYVIVSEDLISKMLYFRVSNFKSTLSDCHCMLSCGLLATYYRCPKISNNIYKPFPGKFIWDDSSHIKLHEALASEECSKMVNAFLEENFEDPNAEEINKAVENFNDIVLSVASKSLHFKKPVKTNRKVRKHKKWFDEDLQQKRKLTIEKGELLSQFPHDPIVKADYYKSVLQGI